MTTEDQLRAAIGYDPVTGHFWWKIQPRGGKYAGQECGCVNGLGYLIIKYRGHPYKAHRLAWFLANGSWPDRHIDHVDGNPSNNALSNLREATRSQNMANRKVHTNNTSGVKGVYIQGKTWRATVQHNGERHYLGSFRSLDEAVAARHSAATRIFGEFAREGV